MDRKEIYTMEFARRTFDYDQQGFLVWKQRRGRINEGTRAGTFGERTKCRMINIEGISVSARRLIWLWHGHSLTESQIVSPMNLDQDDDRIENLFVKELVRKSSRERTLEDDVDLIKKLFRYDAEQGVIYRLKGNEEERVVGDRINYKKVFYQTHRICFILHHGRSIGDGLFIDHANGDHTDNRASNLREATNAQNQMNRRRQKNRKNELPKGVYPSKGKFKSLIRLNGKTTYLGNFNTVDEAALAYRNAANLHFGSYARFE